MSDQPPAPPAKKRKPAPRKRKPAARKAAARESALETVAAESAPVGPSASPGAPPVAADPAADSGTTPAGTAIRTVQAPALPAPGPGAPPAPVELIRVPLSVRWRDLDAFNHVNNSKYLSYLEEARLRWMLTMPGMGLEDQVAPVVAASNLNYKRPIQWPSEVRVVLFVERLGNTSVTIGHRIVDAANESVIYCDGQVVLVWIDRETGRAAPLPEAVRASCR